MPVRILSPFSQWMVAAAVCVGSLAPSWAAQPLSIMATTTSGQPNPGYLQKADANGLVISASVDGASSITLPYANIRELNVDEPKGWTQALNALNAGDYATAESAFNQLANDYANLLPWKDGFGSLARLNHFKALKGLGKLTELGAAMDRQLAQPLALSDFYQLEFSDLKGWAILGKGDFLGLELFLKDFQVEGSSKFSLQPAFKPMPGSLVASLAYLRGVLNEKQQQPDLALVDYHTAMTYNLGSNPAVFRMAALNALKITEAQLKERPTDLTLKRQAHSLATTYRDVVGQGKVPAEFAPFLEPVPDDKAIQEPATENKDDKASS